MKIAARPAFLLAMTLISAPAAGQSFEDANAALIQARAALRAAEAASQEAKASAAAAARAAADADRQLGEAKRLMAALTTGVPVAPPTSAPLPPEDARLAAKCPDSSAGITTVQHFRAVADCEKRALAGTSINPFKAKVGTGFGTSVVAGSSGASGTFTLESVTPFRNVFDGVPFPGSARVEQQRVARRRFAVGIRADVGKEDPKFASVATFGELDRLTSKVALFGRFGWDYSTSEEFRFRKGAKSDFVEKRAEVLAATLAADCTKTPGRSCTGIDLLRWLFEAKKEDGAERQFAHPDFVKLYNDVFWGPPPVDPRPLYGWSIKGEISRPTFDYYPFALAKLPVPFKPGAYRTGVDPAQIPPDFANRIVKDEARIDFSLSGRAFYHLSRFRTGNALSRRAPSMSRFVERTSGTTFVGSLSYVRKDEIERQFAGVELCPPSVAGQAFANDSCRTLNVAAPVRRDSFVAGAEIRQGVDPFWIVPPMLLSARYTRDLETKENGLAAPIFFGTDLTGTFTSGVRIAHTWGGRSADGSNRKAETQVGIVLGLSIGLDGTTGMD
ncbi:hypothetical protein [Sphingomonas sp. 2SG]|uniref:hypothetical protein n=1 Tax=Sphingomonas sp. 2SG TaxID=2502201 RepID=UPI0010F6EF1B|nr:hypothetical protein [Sphingomonas sp. 2SG]